MKKIIIRNGLISGGIVTAFMLTTMAMTYNTEGTHGSMLMGFASMFIAFAFIFVGIRQVRERVLNGVISYGKAFMVGLYISLIASTMYLIGWALEYNLYMPDFMTNYSMSQINELVKQGLEPKKLHDEIVRTLSMMHSYKNPLVFVAYTYMEILPVGIVVTLVASAIQMRSKKGPVPFS